jgi:hypothetical protein
MIQKLLYGIVLAGLCGVARADVVADFGADVEGWSIVAYPFRGYVANPGMQPAIFDATFGNPQGSLRTGDVYGETGVAAPPAFLGDQSASYGHSLSYDIFLRYVDLNATYPAVVLRTTGMSVYFDAPAPTVGVWESRVVPLTEAGWRLSGTTTPVDEATFRAVLANLLGLYIYTEWHSGADDTSLDNVRLGGTIIGVDDVASPTASLRPCYPNPFNPLATIRFDLANAGPVRLEMVSPDGRLVRTLLAQWCEAGTHATTWDGRDDAGRLVASGTYLCRLAASTTIQTTRLTLIK